MLHPFEIYLTEDQWNVDSLLSRKMSVSYFLKEYIGNVYHVYWAKKIGRTLYPFHKSQLNDRKRFPSVFVILAKRWKVKDAGWLNCSVVYLNNSLKIFRGSINGESHLHLYYPSGHTETFYKANQVISRKISFARRQSWTIYFASTFEISWPLS